MIGPLTVIRPSSIREAISIPCVIAAFVCASACDRLHLASVNLKIGAAVQSSATESATNGIEQALKIVQDIITSEGFHKGDVDFMRPDRFEGMVLVATYVKRPTRVGVYRAPDGTELKIALIDLPGWTQSKGGKRLQRAIVRELTKVFGSASVNSDRSH